MKLIANTLGVSIDVPTTLTIDQAREYLTNTGYDASGLQANLVNGDWVFSQAVSTKG